MTNERRCTQTKCGYYLQGGCQSCDDCKAKPFIINIGCQRCLSCEGEEDVLRFGSDKQKIAESEMLKIKQEAMQEAIPIVEEKPKKEEKPLIIETIRGG